MEYLIALILGLLGFSYMQYQGRKKAETDVKLAETKGKDSHLVTEVFDVRKAIEEIDEQISLTKKNKVTVEETLTDEEKASKWNKK